MMANGDPRYGFFYPILTRAMDSHNIGRKCHNHRSQSNPWHCEEETRNKKLTRLQEDNIVKQPLSLPQRDHDKTSKDTKRYM